MGSEAAPEFIFDQGLYYPAAAAAAAADYYGYYCTEGIDIPSEWDDQHIVFGSDGQSLHYSGLQTESLPYVYYAPSYGYDQSANTYNPYMPGAVIGIDGQYTGTEQYFANLSYDHAFSLYAPAFVQSTSDVITNSSQVLPFTNTGASIASHRSNNAGSKYTPPPFSNAPATSQRFDLGSSISKQSNSHIQTSVEFSKGSLVNATASKQSHGAMATDNVPYLTQVRNPSRNGSVSSALNPLKVTMPCNNGSSSLGSCIRGIVPSFQVNGAMNHNGSQNFYDGQIKGPRSRKSKDEFRPNIVVQAYTTKAGCSKMQENITINADTYNRDDFLVEYPFAIFFVIKSFTEDDVHKSIKYKVWSSTHNGNKKLNNAYEDAQRITATNLRKCPVFLFFSVNTSGQFCGVAEMDGGVDFYKNMDFWQQNKWIGSFPVKWHMIKDVPNSSLRHIILENNEYIPVTSSRDAQEIPYIPGLSMLEIFKNSPMRTSILDDFLHYENREKKILQQKSWPIGKCQTPKSDVKQLNDTDGDNSLNSDHPPESTTNSSDTIKQPLEDGNATTGDIELLLHPNVASLVPSHPDGSKSILAIDPRSKLNENNLPPASSDGKQLKLAINQQHSNGALSINSDLDEADPSSSPIDIVTIGSMHINVSKCMESFCRKFIVGSIPVDVKGLNAKKKG